MSEKLSHIESFDPELAELVHSEEKRQREVIRLIASENYASDAVMEGLGSVLNNKYAEGYIGKRYYQGQQFVDKIEGLAIARAKQLFGAEHANVQPYSGSPANLAAYVSLMKPGDKLLGMGLPAGGHLTHGWKVSVSGMFFDSCAYGVRKDTELLDYDEIRDMAVKVKPKVIVCGASAYPRIIEFSKFRDIADEVGAHLIADMAHISGLVVGKVHPSPVPHADVVTSTTHKTLRGPRNGLILCKSEFAKAVDKAVFPGCQGGSHLHAITALAVALKEALTPEFTQYAQQIVRNCKYLGDKLMEKGYRLVTGGTDNHLMVVDLTNKNIGGKVAAVALEKAGIVVNANTIPFEPRSPFDPSGIRIGTAAITTRGMKEPEMDRIANWIDQVVIHHSDDQKLEAIRKEIAAFASEFPTFAY